MSRYLITPCHPQPGFKVEVTTESGSRHTMLGFATHDDAAQWVTGDRTRDQVFRTSYLLDDAAD